jgi:hypothetical protein
MIGVVQGAGKLAVVGPSFKRPESVPFTEFCINRLYIDFTRIHSRDLNSKEEKEGQ